MASSLRMSITRTAKLLTRDEARRIAANIAKLLELLLGLESLLRRRVSNGSGSTISGIIEVRSFDHRLPTFLGAPFIIIGNAPRLGIGD